LIGAAGRETAGTVDRSDGKASNGNSPFTAGDVEDAGTASATLSDEGRNGCAGSDGL